MCNSGRSPYNVIINDAKLYPYPLNVFILYLNLNFFDLIND